MESYDTIIIGAGAAGMSAAIYAQRFGLRTLILGQQVGGLLNESHNVENYPGFPSIPGLQLMGKFKEHVDALGIELRPEWVTSAHAAKGRFEITTDGGEYLAQTIILATGTKHRHLGCAGEERLMGRGVSYCATCDGAFFRNVPVAVVGGGDAAAQAGNLLAQHASHVYMLVRRDVMRAEPLNRERLEKNPKVTIIYNTQPVEVLGEQELEALRLSAPFHGSDRLKVSGMFVEIGADVQNEVAQQLGCALNERGEIKIDAQSATSVPGVWAAGDCGDRRFKQAITGAAEGVIAAFGAFEYVQRRAQ